MNMNDIQKKLRKANKENYTLYLFCNFMGLLLITAFTMLMFSDTVMNVFPVGGDSRKQMYAIFTLTCVGCLVFTIYSASLFFRKKARQTGIFLALGASRKRLFPSVVAETVTLSGIFAGLGLISGIPVAAGLWNLFRILLVDTPEMVLKFNYIYLVIPVVFWLLVVMAAVVTGYRHLMSSNIMDVIHEEHKNEPLKELKPWCGPLGIFLLFGGAILGYYSEIIYRAIFQAYGPSWLAITYLPVFIGLYMILLHTVVHGWGRRKNPYKGIIARSMMKFQGKQTVNNMLVVTVLVAGGCFGLFYIPFSYSTSALGNKAANYDYSYQVPESVNFDDGEVERLAREYQVQRKDNRTSPYLILAVDGQVTIEDENNGFHYEYWKLQSSVKFLGEKDYEMLTGQNIDVKSGTYQVIHNDWESSYVAADEEVTLLTNMTTQETLPITYGGKLHFNQLTGMNGYCVLNDGDYETVSMGLDQSWKGEFRCFQIEGEDSYEFSKTLYHTYVSAMEAANMELNAYDPVYYAGAREAGIDLSENEPYMSISYDEQDTSAFRIYWDYYPQFRIMNEMDFLKDFAVFFMTFLFIVIVCYLAAIIICYTRCMTITINNRYVFDDLEKLGASHSFIKKEIKRQASKVYLVPSLVGMSSMFLLYILIMYANDGKITTNEIVGMLACSVVLLIFTGIFYGVYRFTIRQMCRLLIQRTSIR